MRCCIGIDRMTLYKIGIESYDKDVLLAKKEKVEVGIRMKENTNFYLWDWDCEKVVTKIHIKDNVWFSNLTIGSVGDKNHRGVYVYLQLSVALASRGHNLIPYSYEQYCDYLHQVVKYIQQEYGLKLDIDECCVKEIEINATFNLQRDFTEYDRVWKFLLPLMASKLKKMIERRENLREKKKELYMLSGQEYSVVIYDKKKQLIDTYGNLDLSAQYIARIEYKFGTKKCENALGTKQWGQLSDDKIWNFFGQEIEKVERKIDKWMAIREKELRKKFIEYRKKYKKNYHYMIMNWIRDWEIKNGIPYILEISQLYDMLRNTKEPITIQHNLSRIIGNFRKALVLKDSLDNNDLQKLEEVLSVIKQTIADK